MSLENRLIAISISNAPDLARLGYPQREVDRVLLSLCTALVRAGARVVYGGNLDPTGLTFRIFRHLAQAYAVHGPKAPFVHVVPEPVLRRANFDDLAAMMKEARGTVETVIALADQRVARLQFFGESDEPAAKGTIKATVDAAPGPEALIGSHDLLQDWLGAPRASPLAAYSVARETMTRMVTGRVVMGGKMGLANRPDDHYEGAYPGVIEEAVMALTNGQALVTLGAFGGAARDLAIALGLLDPSEQVPRGPQNPSYRDAIETARGLAERIPDTVRADLRQIARDDRADALSYAIVQVLDKWPRAPGPAPGPGS